MAFKPLRGFLIDPSNEINQIKNPNEIDQIQNTNEIDQIQNPNEIDKIQNTNEIGAPLKGALYSFWLRKLRQKDLIVSSGCVKVGCAVASLLPLSL